LVDRLRADLLGVEASAVVAHLDRDLAALVVGADPDHALLRLAHGSPLLGWLDPVIDRVPNEVRERVPDRFDDRPVQLGLLAFRLDPRPLAERDREVAHDAGDRRPRGSDRLETRLHHAFLQLRGDAIDRLRGGRERLVVALIRELDQVVARQNELADDGHEPVEEGDIDADGRVRRGGTMLGSWGF
jgi:hypothetical protein